MSITAAAEAPVAYLPTRMRHLSRILRAERQITEATAKALHTLALTIGSELADNGYTASVMDTRSPEWREALAQSIMPLIAHVYDEGYRSQQRGGVVAAIMPSGEPTPGMYGAADHLATAYLQSVYNRMVGVADDVFRVIAASLEEGRQAEFTLADGTTVVGESIPELAKRVEAALNDTQRWHNRGTVVARTEVIGANNAGAHAAAYGNAELFGVSSTQVVKEWLATHDHRTRPTHQDADGQMVVGLDTPFSVGAAQLQQPGDPAGPPGEVIQCRCTTLYHYPGDPDYPDTALVAAAAPQEDPMTTAPTEAPAPDAPPADGPTHAGVAVQAADTGRVLMIQRSLDQDDAPDVLGTWEFPGGGMEDGDADLQATAFREFMEETGLPMPTGEVTGGWASENGVYQGFVFTTPVEATAFPELNPDLAAAEAINPDDPQRRNPDVSAWWTVDGIQGAGSVIRPEVLAGTDWTQFAPPVPPEQVAQTAEDLPDDDEADDQPSPAMAAAADTPPQPTDAPVTDEQPVEALGDAEMLGGPWNGILAPEDVVSGDDRMFGAESLIARDLPLPLMYQDATDDGHDGAVRVGRIDKIWRDTTRYSKPMIRYSGVWDTSDIAQEAKRQVQERILRGVSIDGDQVTAVLIGSDGQELDPMAEQAPADGVVIEKCTAARIDGGTLCSVPAFQQAYLINGEYDPTLPEPGQDEVAGIVNPLPDSPEAVAAAAEWRETCAPAWSLVASVDSWVLPAAHFSNPNLDAPTALTVDADGRVYGHLALWGTCHLNTSAGRRGNETRSAGKCMEVPTSASNYAYFGTGVVHTDDGAQVNVGQLTMNTGHANLRFGAQDAMAHYDNTGAVVADITVGHDTFGIWFSGHLRPEATEAQVHALTASGSVSGDWREVIRGSRQLELVAALVVNVPGFPIGRPQVTRAAGGPTALVASGAVVPETMAARTSFGFSDEAVAEFSARVMAHMARTERLSAARARVRTHRATALAARINKKGA